VKVNHEADSSGPRKDVAGAAVGVGQRGFALSAALGDRAARVGHRSRQTTLWEARPFWHFLLSSRPFAALLLAVRVSQIDPLVGTTAAWRTMPLSRGHFCGRSFCSSRGRGGWARSERLHTAAAWGLRFQDVAWAGVFRSRGLSSWAGARRSRGATTSIFPPGGF